MPPRFLRFVTILTAAFLFGGFMAHLIWNSLWWLPPLAKLFTPDSTFELWGYAALVAAVGYIAGAAVFILIGVYVIKDLYDRGFDPQGSMVWVVGEVVVHILSVIFAALAVEMASTGFWMHATIVMGGLWLVLGVIELLEWRLLYENPVHRRS